VVHDLGLVLGGDPGEVLALGLGDAQLLVRLLHRVGQLVPRVDLMVGGLDVVVDVVEEDLGHVPAPVGHGPPLEVLQGLEAVLPHPVGLALHPGHLLDEIDVQAPLGLEDVVLFVGPAQLVTTEIEIDDSHGSSFNLAVQSVGAISPTAMVTILPGLVALAVT
jgi:hypothetical protein